jgi:hypothetical protein
LRPPGSARYIHIERLDSNRYPEVYSRDLGVLSCTDVEEGEPTADFDGRDVIHGFGELNELVLTSGDANDVA